jgi:hypothetical protein
MHFPSIPDACTPRRETHACAANWSIRSIGAYPSGSGKARPVWFRTAFTAAFCVVLALAAGCRREPPEEALRARIAGLEQAIEARDADALAEGLAEDFAGPDGMDRDRLRRTAALLWLRNREVGVALGPVEVELVGDRAKARFTAATRGGEGLLPDRAQVYRVETGWRLDDGEWRLISARWEPAL